MIYTPWYTLFTKCPHFAKLDIHIFRKVHSLHWVYMVRVCKIIIVHSKTMLSPLPHLLFLALTIYSSSFFFFQLIGSEPSLKIWAPWISFVFSSVSSSSSPLSSWQLLICVTHVRAQMESAPLILVVLLLAVAME